MPSVPARLGAGGKLVTGGWRRGAIPCFPVYALAGMPVRKPDYPRYRKKACLGGLVVFLHQGQVYAEDRIEELLHRDDPVLEDFFGGED